MCTKPNADGNLWLDGYHGQKTIIFDEFYGWIKYDLLLRICDRYPLQLPIKGGFVQCQATTFVFTSNKRRVITDKWLMLEGLQLLEEGLTF